MCEDSSDSIDLDIAKHSQNKYPKFTAIPVFVWFCMSEFLDDLLERQFIWDGRTSPWWSSSYTLGRWPGASESWRNPECNGSMVPYIFISLCSSAHPTGFLSWSYLSADAWALPSSTSRSAWSGPTLVALVWPSTSRHMASHTPEWYFVCPLLWHANKINQFSGIIVLQSVKKGTLVEGLYPVSLFYILAHYGNLELLLNSWNSGMGYGFCL